MNNNKVIDDVKYKALTVLIPEELHREFKTLVSSKGLKLKDCVVELMTDYIENNK